MSNLQGSQPTLDPRRGVDAIFSPNNGQGSALSATTQTHNAQGAATPQPTPELSILGGSTGASPSNFATLGGKLRDPKPDAEETLKDLEEELDTPLFHLLDEEGVYGRLRWAGFENDYKTLSLLLLSICRIVRVQEPALHLMWTPSPPTHFIKPLPSALARREVVKILQGDYKNTKKARGLLYSYTRLIHSELDYRIAVENNLLPWSFANNEEGWRKWYNLMELFRGDSSYLKYDRASFHIKPDYWMPRFQNRPRSFRGQNPITNEKSSCKEFARSRKREYRELEEKEKEAIKNCHRRYYYGELKLERVNLITWINGYGDVFRAPRWGRIDALFKENKSFIAAFTIYTGLMLTAMQVSLQASDKPEWVTQACRYIGYVVIIGTGAQPLLLFSVFGLWLVWQWISFRLGAGRLWEERMWEERMWEMPDELSNRQPRQQPAENEEV